MLSGGSVLAGEQLDDGRVALAQQLPDHEDRNQGDSAGRDDRDFRQLAPIDRANHNFS